MIMKHDKYYFSLVELLVVIAIIAILAGLVMPAFSNAKKSGHRIQCVNNLAQIGKSIEMYSQENNNRYPYNATSQKLTDSDHVPLMDILNSYLPNKQIFACPDEHENLFETEGSSYIWNWLQIDVAGNNLAGQPKYNASPYGMVSSSGFPLMVDAAAYHGPSGKRRSINVLFADGNVNTGDNVSFGN